MKKRTIIIWSGAFLALSIVGPFIINGLYLLGDMIEKPFVTKLDASDMLGYYGTIIGSAIAVVGVMATVWTLKRTIEFTRNQIQYERYIQSEHEKWNSIEKTFNEALEKLNPEKLNNIYMSLLTLEEKRTEYVLYRTAIYNIYANLQYNLTKRDKEKIQQPLDDFFKLYRVTFELAQDFRDLLDTYDDIDYDNKISDLMKKALALHKTEYAALYRLKRDFFDNIYQSIEEEAEKILK